jgi:hypothetical protein
VSFTLPAEQAAAIPRGGKDIKEHNSLPVQAHRLFCWGGRVSWGKTAAPGPKPASLYFALSRKEWKYWRGGVMIVLFFYLLIINR